MTDELVLSARLAGEELSQRLSAVKRKAGVLDEDKGKTLKKLYQLREKINGDAGPSGLSVGVHATLRVVVNNSLTGTCQSFDCTDSEQTVELIRYICGELRSIGYEKSREAVKVQDSLSILDSALNKLEV